MIFIIGYPLIVLLQDSIMGFMLFTSMGFGQGHTP